LQQHKETRIMLIYVNGEFLDKDDAKISVFDHGLLYGDGVFEGIRVYHGKVFKLKEHIDRLYESAKSIYIEIPMTRKAMWEAVQQTVRMNEMIDGYIRLVVTRGIGPLGLDPRTCKNPTLIIIADAIALYPPQYYQTGLEIMTVATTRNHPSALNPRIKSLNYLNNVMARLEAALAGCQEALMLNHKGEIAECSGDNIFLYKNGEVLTPPLDAGLLAGVTRSVAIELARAEGIVVREVPLTRHDVYIADEVFLTGTAAEIVAVVKCDGRFIGSGKPGPLFKKLRDRFTDYIRSDVERTSSRREEFTSQDLEYQAG
jgi:branched-chain amino acid aminotransferase